MNDDLDPVKAAFDDLRDGTRRLDVAEPLRSVAQSGGGRLRWAVLGLAALVGFATVVVVVRDVDDGDLVVGPADEIGDPDADGAGPGLADRTTLIGSSWTLVSGHGPDGDIPLVDIPLVDGWPITLTFDAHSLGGTAACNDYGGGYTINGDAIAIEVPVRNAKGCAPPVTASETAFLSALPQVEAIHFVGPDLLLTGPSTELLFRRNAAVPNEELVGQLWLLETIHAGDNSSGVVGSPATLLLQADGNLVAGTGCRSLAGSYIVSGNQVVLTSFGAEGECPSELRGQDSAVITVMEGGFTVEIHGDNLTLMSTGNEGLTYRAITEDELESTDGTPVVSDGELLIGTSWILLFGEGPAGPIDIVVGREPTIAFTADGRVTGSLTCNEYEAPITIEGSRIELGPLFKTDMNCAPAEAALQTALSNVAEFAIENEGDQLVMTGTSIELVFTTATPAPEIDGATDISELIEQRPTGTTTVGGVAIDTGGGWILCDRSEEQYLGCGGRWVTVTNFDPAVDSVGVGTWEGELTSDGRFAISGRDAKVDPAPEAAAIADAFAALFVRDPNNPTVDISELRLADTVLLGLGNQFIEERAATDLTEANAWVLEAEYFRAYDGPFSVLESLERSGETEVIVGPHNHCASPPQAISDQIIFETHLSIQPVGIDSCLLWFTLDLFLNADDRVVAITLDVWEP